MTTRPEVAVGGGKVRGVWREASAAFLGIPFAAPPVGVLRFAAPAPTSWDGVLDAGAYGPTAQRRPFGPVVTIPEPSIPGDSTLNVNIFTPAPGDRRAGLPVLVWIHGGGFFAGSPASPWYDGSSFNRDGVVTVTVSYRLGFDGFGWIEDAPGNRGVLDQMAALRWVRENIEVFGGDPARVTIAGQSAGGGSVLTLLGIPGAQDLFAAAIAQSGVARGRTLAAARQIGERFAARMGVAPTRAGWSALSETEILDGQQEMYAPPAAGPSPEDRAAGLVRSMTGKGVGGHLPFVPHVDETLIPHGTIEALAAGVGGDKPLLLGANAHEFTMVLMAQRDELSRADAGAVLTVAGVRSGVVELMRARFGDSDPAMLIGQYLSEAMFRMPLVDVVDARDATDSPGRTWLYDFRWTSPVGGLSAHCLELPFVWDLLDAEGAKDVVGDAAPSDLADVMHRTWVRFVNEQDPGWQGCAAGERPGFVFDAESRPDPDPYGFEREMIAAGRESP